MQRNGLFIAQFVTICCANAAHVFEIEACEKIGRRAAGAMTLGCRER